MSRHGGTVSLAVALQGIPTPYCVEVDQENRSEHSVKEARLMQGGHVLKRHEYPRQVSQAVAYNNLMAACGAAVAMDQARGEAYAKQFNYAKWQADRAAAATVKQERKKTR